MIDKTAVAEIQPFARKAYAGLLVAGTCMLLLISFFFGEILFKEYLLDKRYEREGIKAEGVISSFRHLQATGENAAKFTGYYPNVSFSSPSGPITLKATSGAPFAEFQVQGFIGWKVEVIYLPGQPETARVVQWPETTNVGAWVVVMVMCSGIALLGIYLISVLLLRAGSPEPAVGE